MEEDLMTMGMHEEGEMGGGGTVKRVPGGWIYRWSLISANEDGSSGGIEVAAVFVSEPIQDG